MRFVKNGGPEACPGRNIVPPGAALAGNRFLFDLFAQLHFQGRHAGFLAVGCGIEGIHVGRGCRFVHRHGHAAVAEIVRRDIARGFVQTVTVVVGTGRCFGESGLARNVVEQGGHFTRTGGVVLLEREEITCILDAEHFRIENPVFEILVANTSNKAYSPVLMHLPPYLTAKAVPEVLGRGKNGRIEVTLD